MADFLADRLESPVRCGFQACTTAFRLRRGIAARRYFTTIVAAPALARLAVDPQRFARGDATVCGASCGAAPITAANHRLSMPRRAVTRLAVDPPSGAPRSRCPRGPHRGIGQRRGCRRTRSRSGACIPLRGRVPARGAPTPPCAVAPRRVARDATSAKPAVRGTGRGAGCRARRR